ncbi:MAG: hypothetical protein IKK01_10330 [Clostridia bacterium]|nr:hypothetical protein [Clostridia bacterium]
MKKYFVLPLIAFILCILTACEPGGTCIEIEETLNEDTKEQTEERFFNLTPTSPAGWCVDPGAYRNIYTGAPDIPPVGSLKFTNLAAYLANTAEDGEEMYFLVGVTDSKNSSGTPKGWTNEEFMSFVYNGKTVEEYLSSFEYHTYCKDNSTFTSYASWDILSANLYAGMTAEEALKEENYVKVSKMHFDYWEAYYRAYAAFLCEIAPYEQKPAVAEYLEEFGIELYCDPSTEEWRYHLQVIKTANSSIGAINDTMDFLVKCTKEDLWALNDGNTEYGLIFYASDSDGRFIVSNQPPIEGYRGNLSSDLCYLDRRLIDGHVAFSYEELGIYERLKYE